MRNWIQDHALQILIRTESARLKDLIPENVEPNLFSYHLNQLVSAGYIQNVSRGRYELTASGQALAGSVSTKTRKSATSPKSVIMFYIKDSDRILLWQWSRQPYMAKVTLPYDRIPAGQPIHDAIGIALRDKIGLTDSVHTSFLKSGMVRIYTGDTLVSHMNAFVYAIEDIGAIRPFIGRNGNSFWEPRSGLQRKEIMEGLERLIAAIEQPDIEPFDVSLSY